MVRQQTNCNLRGQGSLYTVPIPLYDRVDEADSAPIATVPVRSRVARSELEETQICRHSNSTLTQSTAAEREALSLLRQQNELITGILAALNTQISIALNQSSQGQ